jgi:hypothetical protein
MLHVFNGVPLVYFICENEEPKEGTVYDSFIQEHIDNCKVTGQEFAEDTNYAHYVIQSLVVGEDAELWVKDNKRSEIGRTDFLTLVADITGEGNNTDRIGDAERLEKTIHYKDDGISDRLG